jgi:tetratricopeptide (TPR) repeat protein
MQTYSLRDLQSALGISRAVIAGLVASGFVTPTRGPRNEYRFTFQDVVLLRTAYSLRQARIPARKILHSLRRLRASLPNEVPLTGLRITAVGNEVAVQDGGSRRHVDSGQLLFDFDVQATPSNVSVLDRGRQASERGAVRMESVAAAAPGPATPVDWFEHGARRESESKADAEAAYRRALALAPDYVDAYLNLGVLLCDSGRSAEAIELYRSALRHCPSEALLHFNAGVALEDLQRHQEALDRYEACLRLTPKFADAHYNAARLHEQLGHASQAIRHYSEYRRLLRR